MAAGRLRRPGHWEEDAARDHLGALLCPELHETPLRVTHYAQPRRDIYQLCDRVCAIAGLVHCVCYRNKRVDGMSQCVAA